MFVRLCFAVLLHMVTISRAEDNYCYAQDTQPYVNFATKTAYAFVSNKGGIPLEQGCKEVQIWMLCRHGTRWPRNSEYPSFYNLSTLRDQVISNYNAKYTSLCSQDVENLKNFTFDIPLSKAELLNDQGRNDMLALGQRTLTRFYQLFDSSYSPEKYTILDDGISRTRESAAYFAKGLFGMDFNTTSLPETNSNIINLIRPYHTCQKWIHSDDESKMQVNSFLKSQWMISLIARVSSRLGFTYTLSMDDVTAIYNGCTYFKAWSPGGTSAWCTAFTTEDLKVMEYRRDLQYFYKTGQDNPFTYKLSCPLLRDLIDKFRSVAMHPDATRPKAVLYFSHDSMLQLFSVALGIAKDSLPLTSEDMPYEINRRYRTSFNSPFAGNIVAVLYNCSERGLRVGFYLQERPVEVPGCGGHLCDLDQLLQLFSPMTDGPSCMDLSFCTESSGSIPMPGSLSAALTAFVLTLLLSSS